MEYFLGLLFVTLFTYGISKIGDSMERSNDPYTPCRESNVLIKSLFFIFLFAIVFTLLTMLP